MLTREPSQRQAALRLGVAAGLLVVVIMLWVFGARFPQNAPVETLFCVLFSLSLIGGIIAFIPLALRAGTRSAKPVKSAGVSKLSIIALPLTVVPLLVYLALSPLPVLVSGERLRYMVETFVPAILSGPIVLGIVFAVVGLRRGGRLTVVFSAVSLACALLLVIAMGVPTVLYGLALTD